MSLQTSARWLTPRMSNSRLVGLAMAFLHIAGPGRPGSSFLQPDIRADGPIRQFPRPSWVAAVSGPEPGRGRTVTPMSRIGAPRPPLRIAPAFDDPHVVEHLIAGRAPYWPVQRYFANDAEYAALAGSGEATPMVVAPVFRGNWATEGVAEPGVEALLHHPAFIDAARRLFDAELVRPFNVYVNLTWQLPFLQGMGHTDIPAFRGFDRSTRPITFLSIMGLSELFEDVRVKIATAVAWLYRGADGGFEYWPDGPDRPAVVHEGAIDNTAIVGDNDFMWHRVRPTGRVEDGLVSLGLDSELVHDEGRWSLVDDGATLATFPRQP